MEMEAFEKTVTGNNSGNNFLHLCAKVIHLVSPYKDDYQRVILMRKDLNLCTSAMLSLN